MFKDLGAFTLEGEGTAVFEHICSLSHCDTASRPTALESSAVSFYELPFLDSVMFSCCKLLINQHPSRVTANLVGSSPSHVFMSFKFRVLTCFR